MKFSCTKENLSQAIGLVSSIASKHVNLPILSNILIKVEDQKVECATTNLEIAITVQVRAKVEEPGSFTVPARTFSDMVNLIREEKVEIFLKDNELHVTSGRSTTKIKGSPAEEFPIIPRVEGGRLYTFSRPILQKALAQVATSVAKTDIRPELSGVFCGFNVRGAEGLTLAATDSYRLAERKIPFLQGEADEFKMIIPGKTAQELARILGQNDEDTVRILATDNQIHCTVGTVEMLSRLVEGSYPDYTQIIPREFKTTARVSTDLISREIKAAGLFTTTGVNAIEFEFDPTAQVVRLASASTQTGEYHTEVPVDGTGEAVKIVLSHRYVLDGLNTLETPYAAFSIVNQDSPCIVRPDGREDFLYIVMPIRQ